MRSRDVINVLQFLGELFKLFCGDFVFLRQRLHDFQRAMKFRLPHRRVGVAFARRNAALNCRISAAALVKRQVETASTSFVFNDRPLVNFRRRVKALFQAVQILRLFRFLKLHVAEVVKRLLLQFQIRRQRDLLEQILRQVKIRCAIRRVARVENQPQIVRLHLRQSLNSVQRVREMAGLVIAQRRRAKRQRRTAQQKRESQRGRTLCWILDADRGLSARSAPEKKIRDQQHHCRRQRPLELLVITPHDFFLALRFR